MVTLRADQDEVTDRTRAALRRCRRVCVVAGCGWGKTHFGCGVVQAAHRRGTPTLILAHRRRLIEQWSERLALFGVPHALEMAQLPDALVERHDPRALVRVASKDTLVSRAERVGLPPAGLVVIDEAHNLLGSEYTNLLANYAGAYHLGLTATPAAGDGRGLGNYFDELVCAPQVSALIAAGVVVPFKVYAALELHDIRKAGGKVKPAGDPVVQWKRHADDRPTVIFAPRVADSRAAVESFVKAGIRAVHIDAHSTQAEREDAAAGLESGALHAVSQVGLWTEGVDVPCVAVVQLLAKCGSLVKYVQAVWRAGRAFPGKDHAVVIDHTGAVFDHGFPDDDLEWSLTPGDPVKKADGGGEAGGKEPFVCSRCGLCYSGALACPGCGSELAINRKMYQPDLFAHLVEVDRDFTAAVKDESAQRVWAKLLFQFARSGKSVKALVAAFKARTGQWPDQAGVSPVPDRGAMGEAVVDVFPDYGRKAAAPKPFIGGGLFR